MQPVYLVAWLSGPTGGAYIFTKRTESALRKKSYQNVAWASCARV